MTQVSAKVPPVKVNKKTPAPALQPFTDYFQGFEKVGAVRKVFGDETEEVLSGLKIGFISNRRMYMGIRDHDGNLAIGTYHLRHSTTKVLYLDIVHELFHIGQWRRDKVWFTKEHEKFMGKPSLYYVSPLEVPAYEHTVREAERLGMGHGEIEKYLEMMPVSHKVWKGFLREMGIDQDAGGEMDAKIGRLPVKINREPKLVLLPFTEYFKGFEDAPPVKALYGRGAKAALERMRVEFLDSRRFGSVFPSEEDGHLVINSSFIKEADLESIYLDVVLGLNVLKRAADAGKSAVGYSRDELADNQLLLESYREMVAEAKRIGTTRAKIEERLQLPRFMMSSKDYSQFVKAIGLKG